MYFLNEYAPVMYVQEKGAFFFYEPAGVNNQEKIFELPADVENEGVALLLHGGGLSYEDLVHSIGRDFTDSMIERSILVPCQDRESIYKRSVAFYNQYGFHDAQERIRQKKVLILGCGGIGTHVAWLMTVLGVGKIALVDFDTVEISNLNRQILYTQQDIGKPKATVLAEHLRRINPEIEIVDYGLKIDSEKTLERVCLSDHFDLIIKALDSPTAFPVWLDTVVRKHNLNYVCGLTYKNQAMLGPTFIAGSSRDGWSDLIDAESLGEKVHGTVSSVGFLLNYVASEVSIEAFKILIGESGLKYKDKIVLHDLFENKETFFIKKKHMDLATVQKVWSKPFLNTLSVLLSAFCSINYPLMIVIQFWISIGNPILICQNKKERLKTTFTNAIVFCFTVLVKIRHILYKNFFAGDLLMSTFIVIGCFVYISVLCVCFCFISDCIEPLIKKINHD